MCGEDIIYQVYLLIDGWYYALLQYSDRELLEAAIARRPSEEGYVEATDLICHHVTRFNFSNGVIYPAQ